MKKYLMVGVSALALCGTFMSCSHDDITTYSGKINVIETYEQAFITRFGQPAPDQDWGFGTATKEVTRAVFTDKWPNSNVSEHSCDWESKLKFSVPAGAEDITKPNYNQNATVFYIPESYTGESFNYNLNNGGAVYNYAHLTSLNGNAGSGTVSIYNAGTIDCYSPSSGHIDIYNTGAITLGSYANFYDIFNSGTLVLAREHNASWPNEGAKLGGVDGKITIHSAGEEAVILMPDGGGYFDAGLDVHNMIYVTGDIQIQCKKTKYVCGIEATGHIENTAAPLITAYIKANDIAFDGNHIYLLPGGYMKAETKMSFPNSACNVYAHTGSVALVEATNFEFGNKNDFTHNFSDNIYFKVNGGYIKVDNCFAGGQSHYFNTVADYLADTTHADEFGLATSRINAGNASGSPACGDAWTTGDTPGSTIDPNEPSIIRIIAEDLTVTENTDFDFNDVVFDVEWIDDNTAKITLQAAGGTLPLTVGGDDYEVHKMFGLSNTNQMINTRTSASIQLDPVPYTITGNFGKDANKIPVKVYKLGEWIELFAERGKPASKIALNPDEQGFDPRKFRWCDERIDIESDYGQFPAWVRKEAGSERWYAYPSVKWN